MSTAPTTLGCLQTMREMFERVVEAYRATGIEVDVEKIGDRPCAAPVDPGRYQALMERVTGAIRRTLQTEPKFRSGSTDCNIPLSVGIPAACISTCTGRKSHTREEELDLDSLPVGSRLFMELLAGYFHPAED